MTTKTLAVKRLIDLILALVAIILFMPIFVAIGFAVRLDGGPIFFRQLRLGRYGRPFHIIKFRSMVVNAPKLGGEVTAADDQRITRIGSLLRKSKLDELPQLLNVFIGDMSLVGPRPEVPHYASMWSNADRNYLLSVKPGITDYATLYYNDEQAVLAKAEDPEKFYLEQVMPHKIKLYRKYVRDLSLSLDFRIILATLGKMVGVDVSMIIPILLITGVLFVHPAFCAGDPIVFDNLRGLPKFDISGKVLAFLSTSAPNEILVFYPAEGATRRIQANRPVFNPQPTLNGCGVFFTEVSEDGYYNQLKYWNRVDNSITEFSTKSTGHVAVYSTNADGTKVVLAAYVPRPKACVKIFLISMSDGQINTRELSVGYPKLAGYKVPQLAITQDARFICFVDYNMVYAAKAPDYQAEPIVTFHGPLHDFSVSTSSPYQALFSAFINGYYQIVRVDIETKAAFQETFSPSHKLLPSFRSSQQITFIESGPNLDLRNLFDLYWLKLTGAGGTFCYHTNDWGRLAHITPNALRSLSLAYEGFGDEFYLGEFSRCTEAIFSNMDRSRGRRDWEGRSEYGWSGPIWSVDDRTPLRLVLHSGNLGHAIAGFVDIVKTNNVSRLTDRADCFLHYLIKVAAAHDKEWVDHEWDILNITSSEEAYFQFPKGSPFKLDGTNLHFNQQNRFGSFLLALYKTTGNSSYLEKAKKLGNVFKRHIEPDRAGLKWHYTWGTSYQGWTSSDDVSTNTPNYPGYRVYETQSSYSTTNLQFAVDLFEEGVVFSSGDIRRLVSTLFDERGVISFTEYGDFLLARYDQTLLRNIITKRDVQRYPAKAPSFSSIPLLVPLPAVLYPSYGSQLTSWSMVDSPQFPPSPSAGGNSLYWYLESTGWGFSVTRSAGQPFQLNAFPPLPCVKLASGSVGPYEYPYLLRYLNQDTWSE